MLFYERPARQWGDDHGLYRDWSFAFYSPILGSVFGSLSTSKVFVVQCKRCSRNIPAGVAAFPFASVVVNCSLCGEVRRYRPSEIYLGRPDRLVARQNREGAR